MKTSEIFADIQALWHRQDYAALVQVIQKEHDSLVLTNPDLGVMLAHALFCTDRLDQGLQVARRIESACAQSENRQLRRRRRSVEAAILFAGGNLVDAVKGWTDILTEAAREGDFLMIARSSNDLGMAADVQRDFPYACTHYIRALSAYHSIGDQRGIMGVSANLGITYRKSGKLTLAEDYLGRAHQYAHNADLPFDRALIEIERGLLYLLTGDVDRASKSAAMSQALLGSGPPSALAEINLLSALINVQKENHVGAIQLLEYALGHARQAQRPLLVAEVQEEFSLVLKKLGELEKSAAARAEATQIFRSFGATARVAALEERLQATGTRVADHFNGS